MGWGSGVSVFDDVIEKIIEPYIQHDKRADAVAAIARIVMSGDCDTLDDSNYIFTSYVKEGLVKAGWWDESELPY